MESQLSSLMGVNQAFLQQPLSDDTSSVASAREYPGTADCDAAVACVKSMDSSSTPTSSPSVCATGPSVSYALRSSDIAVQRDGQENPPTCSMCRGLIYGVVEHHDGAPWHWGCLQRLQEAEEAEEAAEHQAALMAGHQAALMAEEAAERRHQRRRRRQEHAARWNARWINPGDPPGRSEPASASPVSSCSCTSCLRTTMAESLPVSISAAEALAGHGVEPLAENPDAHGCRENMTAETNAVRSAEVGPVPCSTPSLLDGLHVGRNDMRAVCFDTASESVDAGTDWFGEIDDHVEDTLVVLRDVRSQRARPGQLDAAGNVCAGAVVWACARQKSQLGRKDPLRKI